MQGGWSGHIFLFQENYYHSYSLHTPYHVNMLYGGGGAEKSGVFIYLLFYLFLSPSLLEKKKPFGFRGTKLEPWNPVIRNPRIII